VDGALSFIVLCFGQYTPNSAGFLVTRGVLEACTASCAFFFDGTNFETATSWSSGDFADAGRLTSLSLFKRDSLYRIVNY